MTILAGVALLAYLLGSLPTGYITGRLVGVDIRKVGSGNVGATNVTRVLGKRFGYPVFLVDFAKGLAAVMLAVIMAKAAQSSAQFVDLCAAIGAICSLMGHSYSIWLGFRGGKGVATLRASHCGRDRAVSERPGHPDPPLFFVLPGSDCGRAASI